MRSVLVSPSRIPERLFPLVEDLEHSVQWTDLENNIDHLENNYPRIANNNRNYDNLERHTVRRRSMPEIQKANLVYVHRPQERNNPPPINKFTWKPRTEFERSYFGDEALDESSNNDNSLNDLFYAKEICLNDDCQFCETKDCPICLEKNCQICRQGNSQFNPGKSAKNLKNVDNYNLEINKSPDSEFTLITGEEFYLKEKDEFESCEIYPNANDFLPSDPKNHQFDPNRDRSFVDAQQNSQKTTKNDKTSENGRIEKKIENELKGGKKEDLKSSELVQNLKNERSNFSGSRERLQEIFEYNRYLRRQFFADLPASTANQRRNTISEKMITSMRPKQTGIGFGSTETLTSQSNQSADSSTNGRKSRADFSNTPESLINEKSYPNILADNEIAIRHSKIKRNDEGKISKLCPPRRNEPNTKQSEKDSSEVAKLFSKAENKTEAKETINERISSKFNKETATKTSNVSTTEGEKRSLPKIYFGMENPGEFKQKASPIERTESYNILPNYAFEKKLTLDKYTENRKQKSPSNFHQSLPNLPELERNSIARVSVNGSTYNLSRKTIINSNQSTKTIINSDTDCSPLAYTYKPLPTKYDSDDSKFFATYVNISDSSESSTPSSIRKRKRNVPPPLDLSTVNERYEKYNHIPTYTVTVTKKIPEKTPTKERLNSVNNPTSENHPQTKIVNERRRVNNFTSNRSRSSSNLTNNCDTERNNCLSIINKSCCDLTNSNNDLLSPQLVNNFKNSLADLSRCATPSFNNLHENSLVESDNNSVYNNRNCYSPQQWDLNNKYSSTSGTSLSSVYGPMPYNQYCDKMKMSNISIFLL